MLSTSFIRVTVSEQATVRADVGDRASTNNSLCLMLGAVVEPPLSCRVNPASKRPLNPPIPPSSFLLKGTRESVSRKHDFATHQQHLFLGAGCFQCSVTLFRFRRMEWISYLLGNISV